MKIVVTNTGRNTIEDLENNKELIVQRYAIEPHTSDYVMYEFRFERGEEFAKLTCTMYVDVTQEKTVLWAEYFDAKEYDELIEQAKQIASTKNPIDREAKISRFYSYIYEKYHKPDP